MAFYSLSFVSVSSHSSGLCGLNKDYFDSQVIPVFLDETTLLTLTVKCLKYFPLAFEICLLEDLCYLGFDIRKELDLSS